MNYVQCVKVRTDLLKSWLKKEGSGSRTRLAVEVGVSEATINRVIGGHVPRRPVRKLIADAIGVDEADLFPLARGKAA